MGTRGSLSEGCFPKRRARLRHRSTHDEKPQPESGGTGGWGFRCRDGDATKPSRCAIPGTVCFRCYLGGEGTVLVTVAIESDLGPIELGVEADLKTDAETQDPLIHAIDEVRNQLLAFGSKLQDEMKDPDVLTRMMHLSFPDQVAEE